MSAESLAAQGEESPTATSKSGARPLPIKDNSLVLEILDPQNKEQILNSPFSEALKAQEEVDEKKIGIVPRHHYIPRQRPGEITREHEQYNLTYAMMLGIRHSVTSWQSDNAHMSRHRTLGQVGIREMKKGVEESHFFQTYKMYFPPEGGKGDDILEKTPPHLLKTAFKFKDYAPEVFARLRKRFEIDDIDYLNSLCGSFNYLEFISNSKSGEFFFYSHDGKFLIKTQKRAESKFMRRILPDYYNYVADHPNSMLVRICGAHRVKLPHLRRKMHFVIMMSVFSEASETRPVNRIYDLKGATAGRRARLGETVKKDLDIIDDGQKFRLGPKRPEFMLQVERDSKFLAGLGVMDYSLLVGIHERQIGKNNGSFLFRSDRKSLIDFGSSADLSANDSPREGSTPGSSDNLTPSRKAPSLPTTFSKQQILTSALETTTPSPASPKMSRSFENGQPPTLSPKSSKSNIIPSVPRHQNSEQFNSFYKIDSKDQTGLLTGETYHVGVIDIFTQYSAKKQGEHVFKSLQGNGRAISAVNPRQYQQRFVKFISNIAVDN